MEAGPITFENNILNGEAVFTKTHIPVKTLFNSLDSGDSIEDFMHDFPDVSRQQIEEVLVYAKKLVTSLLVIKANGGLLSIVDNPFFPSHDVLEFEKSIEQAINEQRSSLGLAPLTFNEDISTIARTHSMNMAKQIAPFDHSGFEMRLQLAGQAVHQGAGQGENLASGFNHAQDVLQAWLNEPSHKKNLELNAKFAGVGVASFHGGPNFFTLLIV